MFKPMLRPFLMVPALFLLCALAFSQQSTPPAHKGKPAKAGATAAKPAAQPFTVPPEWVHKVNPVRPTAASQARAKQIYGWDCAVCHGDNGNGKGSVAIEQKLNIPDYRNSDALKKLTDGEIFYIIHNGEGQMTGEGPRANTTETWNLVIYLRRMAGESTVANSSPAK